MNRDLCHVSLAELEYDRKNVENVENDDAQEALYVRVLNELLAGKPVLVNNREWTLAERMTDQYQEFADMVDNDIDFMAMFLAGKFKPETHAIFHKEAIIMASIAVG